MSDSKVDTMEVVDSSNGGSQEKKPTVKLTTADISSNILYIIKGVEANQPRLLFKSIRQNVNIRKYITRNQLGDIVKKYFPTDHPLVPVFHSFLEKLPLVVEEKEQSASSEEKNEEPATESMDVAPVTQTPAVLSILPEVEVYIFTLLLTTLLRQKLDVDAAYASTLLIERIRMYNRRLLDVFSSKAYFYYSLAHENIQKQENIRPTLLLLYRTACVRRDEMGQAVLLNLLLRNYLHYNLIEQAHTLSMRANFPENASNNQFCRYLYYLGRIQAIQLEYSEAYQRLMMAVRKAPQGYATGFTVLVYKLVVLVQLLMGDIPERSLFNQPELAVALQPYLALTQAVRNGDLMQFQQVSAQYHAAFTADKNQKLVQRLGHNVLKIGLRKISLSYSRISLQDIATKLHLPSAAAAEYICAKAIRDGVIEAKIDHEQGCLTSHEIVDLYSTEEPQRAFHKRIAFCLDVHNDAVKSMRYPPDDAYKASKEKDGAGKDKDKDLEETIEELLKEMEDDYDE